MKTSKRYIVEPGKIHSLQDLKMEKQRLKFEILKTEENIHSGYRDIVSAFTIKNLATTMINDISATSSVLNKAFSFGKSIMARRKKKKHDKMKDVPDDRQS